MSLIQFKDYDACCCIGALVKVNPGSLLWRRSQTHLLFLKSIKTEWMHDETLSIFTEKGLEIISLLDGNREQISLINHGILDILISITIKVHLLNCSVFQFVSKIIRNLSACLDIFHDNLDNGVDIMRLGHTCLQLALAMYDYDDDDDDDDVNMTLYNTTQFLTNMIDIHRWPIMDYLPTKSFKQMIQIFSSTNDVWILAMFEAIIEDDNDEHVNTLINECGLLQALQQLLVQPHGAESINYHPQILGRLLSSESHATKIINDYPQIIIEIMNGLSINTKTIKYREYMMKQLHTSTSMGYLNCLFENIANKNLFFTKNNFVDSLFTFLVMEDGVSYTLKEQEQQYLTLLKNTSNTLQATHMVSKLLLYIGIILKKKYELNDHCVNLVITYLK